MVMGTSEWVILRWGVIFVWLLTGVILKMVFFFPKKVMEYLELGVSLAPKSDVLPTSSPYDILSPPHHHHPEARRGLLFQTQGLRNEPNVQFLFFLKDIS